MLSHGYSKSPNTNKTKQLLINLVNLQTTYHILAIISMNCKQQIYLFVLFLVNYKRRKNWNNTLYADDIQKTIGLTFHAEYIYHKCFTLHVLFCFFFSKIFVYNQFYNNGISTVLILHHMIYVIKTSDSLSFSSLFIRRISITLFHSSLCP